MLVDSHCHLDFPDFAAEREAVIGRARAAGVETMLTISTRLDQFDGVRAIAEAYDGVWCSVGAHPHEAADHAALVSEQLVALASHPKVIGIGETGLDFHYDLSPRDTQERVFRLHIAASRASGLPLIIHAREADREIARILEEERPPPGVLHCFSSGRALAETAIELGFYVSISGIVTFRNAEELRAIVRDLPLDRLLSRISIRSTSHWRRTTISSASLPRPPRPKYEGYRPRLRRVDRRAGNRSELGPLRSVRSAQPPAPGFGTGRGRRHRDPDRYLAGSARAADRRQGLASRYGGRYPCPCGPSPRDRRSAVDQPADAAGDPALCRREDLGRDRPPLRLCPRAAAGAGPVSQADPGAA